MTEHYNGEHRAHSRITLINGTSLDIYCTDNGMVALKLPPELLLHLSSEEAQTIGAILSYSSALAGTTRRRHLRSVRNGDDQEDDEPQPEKENQ